MTTASTRITLPFASYSTVTWDLPSGRRKGSVPFLRTFESRMVSLCASEMGVGINSSVLIDRKAEHHSLVAGAAGIYAHGDVAGLLVDAEITAQVLQSKP